MPFSFLLSGGNNDTQTDPRVLEPSVDRYANGVDQQAEKIAIDLARERVHGSAGELEIQKRLAEGCR